MKIFICLCVKRKEDFGFYGLAKWILLGLVAYLVFGVIWEIVVRFVL